MKTKALIYCRVSSQRQVVEGHGNSSQEQRCRARAKEKGYLVECVFPDDGISGGLFERPAMQKLIKYLDDNPLEEYVIIFDDLARFARDLEVHLKLRKELVGRGAKLECLNFNFEDSPEGIFIENVLASKAQLDRQQNRRQVMQKMKARLESGYWPFCMPFGLINKKHPIHGKILVKREPYASIYKEAIEKYRDGVLSTIEEFQTLVNRKYKEQGIISHEMSLSTAKETLSEILYAGYIEYEKWDVPLMKAKHEGFISLETYNIVQERLQRRTKPWKRRDYSTDFPLRPHVLCAECNKPMTASWCTGRAGKRYPNYFCRVKGCIYNWKVVRKYKLESEFELLLSSVKPADELIDLAKDVLQEQWDLRLEKHIESRQQTKSEVDDLTASIETYLQRIRKTADEEIITMYEGEIRKLQQRKRQLEQDLNKTHYTSEEFGTASEKVFNTLKKPVSMWQSEDYNDKRTIIGMYFEDKLRYNYKTGFGTATLAYPLALITKKPPVKEASVEMSGVEPESEKTFLKLLQA